MRAICPSVIGRNQIVDRSGRFGFLMPPVGMNLLLASYRLKKPMSVIYRAALPMILVLFVGVLVITYVPAMTTWLPHFFARGPSP